MRLYYRYTTALFLLLMSSVVDAIDTQPLTTQTLHVADGTETQIRMSAQAQSTLFRLEQNATHSLFPFTSSFTAGVVESHPLPHKTSFSVPAFFVIGDDEDSIAWLMNHNDFLKTLHASGMITNVATQERVDAISQQTGWGSLTPVSMEGAESLFQTTHLPFYVSEGMVSQ